jgi:sulfate permease, SulP family
MASTVGITLREQLRIAARDLMPAAYVDPLEDQLRRAFPDRPDIFGVLAYMGRLVLPPGAQLIRQGDASDDLFFIESGRVTVDLHLADGGQVRLGVMGAGTVVGEVALYLGLPRSASVTADTATIAYRMSRGGLRRMAAERPAVAAMFHEFMARVLANRVLDTNRLLEGFRD